MADLNALAVFAKVVEVNSFSEAARRLRIPVSTVSRRVADLEDQLGVRLLERSTRTLRLTDVGSDVLEHARRGAELSDAVDHIVSHRRSNVSGILRLASPPSISDTLLAPLVNAFQECYPNVRVQIFVTERFVDHVAEGVDLGFRVGGPRDAALVARRILLFRHQLLASPAYLETCKAPATPRDLLGHRLLAFSRWTPENRWTFVQANGKGTETVTFQPYLSMNDYAGIVPALLAGVGIGELPPLVRPELLRDGRLVEAMPKWRFRTLDLSVVHLGNRYIPPAVRAFKEFVTKQSPALFPALPT
ncbi:MAG TPA: LysR family transcriptional regulator [Gemmatimonadaceae bacterium]|jgi:DNA-binding transcriptional LysR family regulator|nr:LysR family transcriptional regulator [Gemmatimonadaceae bacterium]